ncbi:Tetratricopeptide-like helical [Cordyceps fumosorosea ARSEF 2679]|uniref:Tetratricopeptide-like helical n=1 Tax=Cordyceps fumosorosea (strain ARSEF 2679) TaxID=1081104 RepID=A0A168EAQ8_CORFA|nr:Tetratricopeptide-like helical [Cordyceps fumosorosea ARSEF 2679]OAA73587.1 Tetratricopeptide-like helical [Cordyceps fumosorosea ARSEF 2679]
MSGSKAALKGINEAVKSQKFDDAIAKSQDLLRKDPQNYQANIFLAFALDKNGRTEDAEKVYKTATELRPTEGQGWQGLIKLYEKQGAQKLGEYQHAVIQLSHIFHAANDAYKAQDVADKFVDFARVRGDRLQYADALWIRLPESPLYAILEGRFPAPAKTYETIAVILEDFEKKRINTLVGERRTRLGAKLNEVTLEVKREVYAQSKLESVYRQLINWTTDDDLRRTYEEKLVQYCHDRLLALPAGEQKAAELAKVIGLANDMVVIKHPFRLAWEIAINWQDHKEISDWSADLLHSYCAHFPESDLYKVITAFLTSPISPFPAATPAQQKPCADELTDDSDDDDGGVPTSVVPLTDEDRIIMITEGIAATESSLGYRLVGEFFLHYGEYESTVEYMRKALQFIAKEKALSSFYFKDTTDAYSLCLATSLVYYQSPRHHSEAKGLFEKVLKHDATTTRAMIGVGLIYEEEEEYDQAVDFLERALQKDIKNTKVRSEAAWVRALKGDYKLAADGLRECLNALDVKEPNKELLADAQYRLGYCLWNSDTSRQARKQRKGECAYAYWLAALNNNLDHAPCYTMLGIFYSDYANDKKRARRCFQKALELSSAEVISAERLSRSFAEDGDWDRVELVAQRVVDSGKVKPPPGSKRKGISWPFAALGVAELNKHEYHKAIVSFQSALRLAPEDYHCWVGLGESYHNSGRYVAATKAIINAQKLEEQADKDMSADSWFTKFMLGNIKRELGEYDDAVELYRSVIKTHPAEEGVIIALMQTMVDNAQISVEKGQFGKAIEFASETIEFASKAEENVLATFNYWKTVGDACSVFASVQSRTSDFPLEDVRAILEKAPKEAFEISANVDKVTTDIVSAQGIYPADEKSGVELTRCIQATILCHKVAVHAVSKDVHAQAVAMFNLGWAEFRAHSCLPVSMRKKSSNYLKAAIRCFKRAIELEAGNADFWNALGVVTSEVNGAVSQHSFVRSIHIDERSPVGWTNLGALALMSGDFKVANEAFTRAQSTDPDYAHAWLGQGFVALLYGDAKEARGLFTHAMDIAEASSLSVRQQYSSSMFDHILVGPTNITIASLLQPVFALNQIQSMRPEDFAFGHLASLFLERTRDHARAVEILETICSSIEADYEQTESPLSLARFTLARIDLARAYLASKSYDKAIECGEMALGLSSDEQDSELTREQRKKARLSAHLTVGLAQFYEKDFGEAEKCFEAALEESDSNPDATCLLSQVLWAQGTEEAKEKARSSLFEVIEAHPDHVQSVLLLGVIGLLDEDEGNVEAVAEELQALRASDRVADREQAQIGEVMRVMATLGAAGADEVLALTQMQTDVMLHPHLPHGWSALAAAAGDAHAAQTSLKVARRGIPPRGRLDATDLAASHAGTGGVADAQRAAVLAPWETAGWAALKRATEGV